MNEIKYTKSEIAFMQLKSAIILFNEGDYVSALTLGSSAGEILSSMCRARGLVWCWRFPAELSTEEVEAFAKKFLNKTKNELKHHDSPDNYEIKADFYFESEMFILNALDNYKKLFDKLPKDKIITDFTDKYGDY